MHKLTKLAATALLTVSVTAAADGPFQPFFPSFGYRPFPVYPAAGLPGGHGYGHGGHGDPIGPASASFDRIATLPNYLNNDDPAPRTVSEIISATRDGKTLVYTDALQNSIGFIDITRASLPISGGKLAVGGSPTSVVVLGNDLALVGVDKTEDFTAPAGVLLIVDIRSRTVVREIDLAGQPDSIALSPDGRYAAIAMENQRDEDVEVDEVEGGLPQLPAGDLAIVDIVGAPAAWTVRRVDLTGLAEYGPSDPEPEFVDINAKNEAVVTLQENNHIVIVDLRTGRIKGHFPAGSVSLTGIDATEDGVISLTESLPEPVAREPDAVTWLPGDLIATANEGDLFGGSRGFTIFDRSGRVVYDSGSSLEEIAVRHGHYPEDRSENKGSEPEGIEYASIGGRDYLFVGSERGSFVAVYELSPFGGEPEFLQLLPAPRGPEGIRAIPERGLLVVSGEEENEEDDEDHDQFGVRSSVMIYRLRPKTPSYPQIVSDYGSDGRPIGWSAMSGLVGAPRHPHLVYGVWDSAFSEARIFTIDVSEKPALIVDAKPITGGSFTYDLEGIAIAPDRTFWVASEGNASGSLPNLLVQTDADGVVLQEVRLPAEIEACRAATTTRGTLGSGYEGLAVSQTATGYVLLVAQQRGWNYTTPECEHLDDDPDDSNPTEPAFTRIWVYDPQAESWDHIAYELDPKPENAVWVGLSEITAIPGGYIVIERDNRTGDFGELKTLKKFDTRALRDGVVSKREKSTYDLLPAMLDTNGWITDKPEGVAVTSDGSTYVVTDNDGVDGWSGETWFLRLGPWPWLFRR